MIMVMVHGNGNGDKRYMVHVKEYMVDGLGNGVKW